MSGRSRGSGGGKRGGRGVMFAKPDEPAFLRRMKEQLGYKEGPNVDTKREALPELEQDDEKDKDDEKPTIVVLKDGDLSAEQVEQLGGLKEQDDDEDDGNGKKVIFKKPTKRPAAQGEASAESDRLSKCKPSETKKVKNKSLLSFDDEEDDDD